MHNKSESCHTILNIKILITAFVWLQVKLSENSNPLVSSTTKDKIPLHSEKINMKSYRSRNHLEIIYREIAI